MLNPRSQESHNSLEIPINLTPLCSVKSWSILDIKIHPLFKTQKYENFNIFVVFLNFLFNNEAKKDLDF
jgi:hypothetical protein